MINGEILDRFLLCDRDSHVASIRNSPTKGFLAINYSSDIILINYTHISRIHLIAKNDSTYLMQIHNHVGLPVDCPIYSPIKTSKGRLSEFLTDLGVWKSMFSEDPVWIKYWAKETPTSSYEIKDTAKLTVDGLF